MNREVNDATGERAHFSSRWAIILSCLGTVIGTGNIWRFSRVVANNSQNEGGLVFLVVWLLFLFIWSIPMLMVEYGTGRYTQRSVIKSFSQLTSPHFTWCGAWVCLVGFMISCYYSVVLGWCFYYFVYHCANPLPTSVDESRQTFKDFAEDSSWPVLTHGVAVLLAGLSVVKGVKTIEKVSMVLVPTLLVIIIFNFVWSLTRSNADIGLTFMFTPHWESFGDPRVWVDALSQNAFDTGAGMGLMIPYSTFMTRHNGIVRYATFLPILNNLVSLISAMTIFSAVFSILLSTMSWMTQDQIVDILSDSGPGSTGLTFIWIPVLFETIGTFGRVMAVFFFLCLSFAGLTSLISNLELLCLTIDDFGISRKWSVPITTAAVFLGGLMSAMNINILTNQDFVWAFALVVNGLMLQGMVIYYGVRNFRTVMVNDFGIGDWHLPKIWEYIVKFLAPVEAVALIGWWAVDLISDETAPGEDKWYEFGRETFMVTIVQWLGLLVLVITVNTIILVMRRRRDQTEKMPLLWAAHETPTENLSSSSRKSIEVLL
ncbi:hypothetical protein C0Q70_07967 [Pomacea canaliculata]|uniref:Sodium-dependent transporter n=1 Tax=Pomacea canaliculata TaxID=400727 RepID=A0A2T7PGI5_POMCA|nr:uncharacterized protein LOC112563252 [Pomacea canaliculata]PVD32527.1 hypothetical protein C0Q70_07967 [Pomacea canaliculata]